MKAIILDFERAAETFDKEIMVKKLEVYGKNGKIFNWFKSGLQK